VGYVYDFGAGEEFLARRGEGDRARRRVCHRRRRPREARDPRDGVGRAAVVAAPRSRRWPIASTASASSARLRSPPPTLLAGASTACSASALPLGRRRRRAVDRPRGRGRGSHLATSSSTTRASTSTRAIRSQPPLERIRWRRSGRPYG
jgi:hypothetical protein